MGEYDGAAASSLDYRRLRLISLPSPPCWRWKTDRSGHPGNPGNDTRQNYADLYGIQGAGQDP